jgi:hypothetical protein
VGGGDDLVTRADAQRFQRQVQAGGGRVDGDAVTAAPLSSPRKALKSASKRLALGPVVTQPERSVSTTSAISSSPISGRAKGRKGAGLGGEGPEAGHRLASALGAPVAGRTGGQRLTQQARHHRPGRRAFMSSQLLGGGQQIVVDVQGGAHGGLCI